MRSSSNREGEATIATAHDTPTRAARALAALLVAACPRAATAATSDAPLGVVTPGPFRALFLDMPLADARGPAGPALELRWWSANSWTVPTTFARGEDAVEVRLDAQVDALELALAIPWRRLLSGALAERLSSTLEARALGVWGGWSDRAIEQWHMLVRTSNFDRESWPRSRVAVRLAGAGRAPLVEIDSAGLALGDLAIRTALRLVGAAPSDAPSRWALALRVDVKLPTGSPGRLGGSGGVDGGVGLSATALPARWLSAHALASVRAVSDLPRGAVVQPRRLQAGLDASLVARLGGVAVVVEDRLSSPLLEDGWRLASAQGSPAASAWYALFRPHNQVSVGVRFRELTAFLSEDFTPGHRLAGDTAAGWFYDSGAPDVVVGLAWARGL